MLPVPTITPIAAFFDRIGAALEIGLNA